MPASASRGRQAALLGLVLVLGWLAGRASTELTPLRIAFTVAVVLGVVGIAWRLARRRTAAIEQLLQYVSAWRVGDGLDSESAAFDTLPDLVPLRDELAAVQQHLQRQLRERDGRLARLHSDTALLQAVLGTMVEGVLVLDSGSRLMYVNRAARRLLEFGSREVTGRLLHELVRSHQFHELVERVLQTQGEQHVEIDLSRKERTLSVSAGPLPIEPAPGAVLVLYDVTDLRRLERMRRDFVSNVSHELKTPLTSIQACADTLLDGGLEDPDINRRFVSRIAEQAERLRELILDLIQLARMESQPEAAEVQPVVLQNIVRDALPSHLGVAESRKMSLESRLPSEPVEVLAEPEGVRTILDNLIRNALAYTPPGGRVEVRVATREPDGVIEVEDTGIGIPREQQERVFERFYRVDKARSREVGGTGLGLAIVKHLVEQFGGSIELESEQGRGSLFRVRLPRPDGQQMT